VWRKQQKYCSLDGLRLDLKLCCGLKEAKAWSIIDEWCDELPYECRQEVVSSYDKVSHHDEITA
jgi:hypothetical protein